MITLQGWNMAIVNQTNMQLFQWQDWGTFYLRNGTHVCLPAHRDIRYFEENCPPVVKASSHCFDEKEFFNLQDCALHICTMLYFSVMPECTKCLNCSTFSHGYGYVLIVGILCREWFRKRQWLIILFALKSECMK